MFTAMCRINIAIEQIAVRLQGIIDLTERVYTVIPRYLDLAYLDTRYLDINIRSRQKQSLFKRKLPGYLDISISTSRYLDIISNPL